MSMSAKGTSGKKAAGEAPRWNARVLAITPRFQRAKKPIGRGWGWSSSLEMNAGAREAKSIL